MAKTQSMPKDRNPGMMLFFAYVIVTLVSAVVIYLGNMFFPDQIVLGTVSIPLMWAVALSAGKLGLVTTFASVFFREWELRRGRDLSAAEMMGAYFVFHFATLWFISRFAEIFGLGLASWVVVLVLAVVLDVLQGAAVVGFQKMFKQQ